MPKKLNVARLSLIRLGDERSSRNLKERRYAYQIIAAITKAFLPSSGKSFCLAIRRGYVVTETIRGNSRLRTISNMGFDNNMSFYQMIDNKESPDDGMLSLEATQFIAKDMAEGWLRDVLRELVKIHGTDALELGETLGIHPALWLESASR